MTLPYLGWGEEDARKRNRSRRVIHPLTDFKRNTAEFLRQLKETGQPVVLTINGKAEIVVQDAGFYQRLLELAEQARDHRGGPREGLGLDEARRGPTSGGGLR